MNKVLLVGINAKYIHSNLAIRYISKYIKQKKTSLEVDILEVSINQNLDFVLDEIVNCSADIICFSVYLWNVDFVRKLSDSLKKIKPQVKIVCGGPEVSYTPKEELLEQPSIDYIICGEGEVTALELLTLISESKDTYEKLKAIQSIAYRQGEDVIVTMKREGLVMADIPFPYDSLEGLEHRILYYETSRGCPFRCAYCLSSIEVGVRFKPLEIVYDELQFFLDRNVTQVKFVDRTFNAKNQHAIGIMEYIIAHDNGITNFHFEVAPELLQGGFIDVLSKARKGLFQLEIGVQSAYDKTLKAIRRHNDFDKINVCIAEVKALNNTHMHVDLIAGLPLESYEEFGKSFDYVYSLEPDQLQLGFLKILKGSYMCDMVKEYGIEYRNYPPYEVLQTAELSYHEVSRLKLVEEMVELFLNSGQFNYVIKALQSLFTRPFKLFESLGDYWSQTGKSGINHSKQQLYQFIYQYIYQLGQETLVNYLQLDYVLNEKPKKKLEWMEFEFIHGTEQRTILDLIEKENIWLTEFKTFNTKQLGRMFHIDRIEETLLKEVGIHPRFIEGTSSVLEGLYMVVNYEQRDFIHNNGEIVLVKLELEEVENG